MPSINTRIFVVKFIILALFSTTTFGESYYEIRSSNGETTLQPANNNGIGPLDPSQQQQQQQLAPQIDNGQSSQFPQFGFSSLQSLQPSSLFSFSNLSSLSPVLYGVIIGVLLVYLCKYFFNGTAKLLSSKFYKNEEEVESPIVKENDDSMDLNNAVASGPHKTSNSTKDTATKSRRRRHAQRLARAAGRVQSQIDDFEQTYV